MTALAVGASVTVSVRDGGTVAIATNGGFASAVVTLTEGGASSVSFGPMPERRVLGPFKEGASVVLTNGSCGAFDYDAETTTDPSSAAITGGTIQGVVAVGPYIAQNGANRLNFRKALAKVLAGQRARLLIMGDSTSVGAGAGTSTANLTGARAKNYPTRLAAALTAAGIPTYNEAVFGDQKTLTATVAYPSYDPRVTLAGGFAATSFSALGGNPWLAAATGAKWSLTPGMTFDTVDVFTISNTGNGSLTVDVDGGATLTTINTNAALAVQKTTVSCTRGTHTLNLTTTSTASTYVLAVIPYDSTVGGLDIIQAGWYGGVMSDYAGAGSVWSPSNATLLAAVAPDLAIVQLTVNDSTNGTTPASFAASLATVESALTTAGAETLLMSGIPSNNANATNGQLAAIVAAVSARAASQSRVYADLGSRCGTFAAMNAAGWMADTLHGNALLYADEGRWIAQTLLAGLQ